MSQSERGRSRSDETTENYLKNLQQFPLKCFVVSFSSLFSRLLKCSPVVHPPCFLGFSHGGQLLKVKETHMFTKPAPHKLVSRVEHVAAKEKSLWGFLLPSSFEI